MPRTFTKSLCDHRQRFCSVTLWLKFFALGFITTVIVSWCCAYFVDVVGSENDGGYLGKTLPQAPCLGIFRSEAFGSQVYAAIDLPSDGGPFFDEPEMTDDERDSIPHWTRLRGITRPTTRADGPYEVSIDIARGWPLLALASAMDAVWVGDDSEDPITIHYGFDVGAFPSGPHLSRRVLPYKPIWIGLVLNTLFYAAILFALPTFVFHTIRYYYRSARNRCPNCNYILFKPTEPHCPECGWRRTEKNVFRQVIVRKTVFLLVMSFIVVSLFLFSTALIGAAIAKHAPPENAVSFTAWPRGGHYLMAKRNNWRIAQSTHIMVYVGINSGFRSLDPPGMHDPTLPDEIEVRFVEEGWGRISDRYNGLDSRLEPGNRLVRELITEKITKPGEQKWAQFVVFSSGWPFRFLWYRMHPVDSVEKPWAVTGGFGEPDYLWEDGYRRAPIQGGFPSSVALVPLILNLSIVWGPIGLVIGVRYLFLPLLRFDQGKCPNCHHDPIDDSGYDAGCPECGWNRSANEAKCQRPPA